MLKEYVLGTDGGTGQEAHAYRDKPVIATMINRRSRFISPHNMVE